MKDKHNIVVVGLGEVGKPLYELISKYHSVLGVDITPPSTPPVSVDVLHICYPFQIRDFVGECARYIDMFKPKLTVINSTVAVGTTRKVAQRSGSAVTYSPVRGKHTRMLEELVNYRKFIGALDPASGELAAKHFESLGMKTKTLSSPEAAELAKLTETTYFGLMIAWAQEVERYADQTGAKYDEIVSFYEEIGFFPPVKYTPGVIGGHCVMPNIELLRTMDDSLILNAIKSSNSKKVEREANTLKTADVTK
jgi:UDP-N-acetyl-D-mannosaminuronate dehydrogenase